VSHRTVAIYGRSLFTEGLGLLLNERGHLRIVWVDSAKPEALQHLVDLRPDVLILDLQHVSPGTMVELLLQPHNQSILALDLHENQLICLSVHPAAAASVDDVLALFEQMWSQSRGRTGDRNEDDLLTERAVARGQEMA
jgi:CheY-like chemotaxis protein